MVARWSSIYCIIYVAFSSQRTLSMSSLNRRSFFFDKNNAENVLTDLIYSKSYYPKEKSLPKNTIVKDPDDDVAYLISKLSDDELIKLLNNQPSKAEYDLNDVAKIVYSTQSTKFKSEINPIKLQSDNKSYKIRNKVSNVEKEGSPGAFFKLDHKAVDTVGSNNDHNYNALQKLNNFLYNYPQTLNVDQSTEDMDKKGQLFDVLVSQLKTLCCKKSNPIKPSRYHFKSREPETAPNDYIFLIVNDEIKSNVSDELISVDPDSLATNSSVLLLGPITSPLSDGQLKFVVSRIAAELSKPEYLPLLRQLAEGTLSDRNMKIMKSLVTGPETRRYIKPHRCNHQSKLARVYGGPKWLICTGYLNINGPSIYD
ncbi:uncharacterized protein LOC106129322 isoform X1 [Amyelois transitella]|uniref:uncharacterized protein LOC106129322 isoform X1 n=2 Tax=Amyelois transitella TaxID=680683 RepID=UPI00298F8C2E|nr:uncharacterized protein LOC106129322 isoform X1 [Amyelois transitella]